MAQCAAVPKYKALKPAHQARVDAAYAYCQTHLSTFKRRSGETYAQHGLEVANVLQEI